MTDVAYSKSSPYYNTDTYGIFLDVMKSRNIPADSSDIVYQIDAIYNHRPDLMAFDLYSNPELWWVFAVRNPDILKDPLFDFKAGTIIYVPKKSAIIASLGL